MEETLSLISEPISKGETAMNLSEKADNETRNINNFEDIQDNNNISSIPQNRNLFENYNKINDDIKYDNNINIQNQEKTNNVLIVDFFPPNNKFFRHNRYVWLSNIDKNGICIRKFVESEKKQFKKSLFAIFKPMDEIYFGVSPERDLKPNNIVEEKNMIVSEQNEKNQPFNAEAKNNEINSNNNDQDNYDSSDNSPVYRNESFINDPRLCQNISESSRPIAMILSPLTNQVPYELPDGSKNPFQKISCSIKRQNFTDQQRKVLNSYLQNHSSNPYAPSVDIDHLAEKTGLSAKQVRTYFTNKRMRDAKMLNLVTSRRNKDFKL